MNALERTRAMLVALASLVLAVTVLADTGSPPPPAIIQGSPSPVTKAQIKAYAEAVKPAYLASIPGGAGSDSYPAFALFVALYPCSPLDRLAYLQMYVHEQTAFASESE